MPFTRHVHSNLVESRDERITPALPVFVRLTAAMDRASSPGAGCCRDKRAIHKVRSHAYCIKARKSQQRGVTFWLYT